LKFGILRVLFCWGNYFDPFPNKIGNVHIMRNTFGGVWRFVTKPCKDTGICTVFCYEGGGGSENPKNRVTYYVDVPICSQTKIEWKRLTKID
jgi:hypothetical protein